MMAIRRLAFPFWLATSRLAHQRGRVALAVLGIAVAAATLAAVFGSALIAQDRKTQQSLEAMPPDLRSVRVNWLSVGSQAEPYDRLDATVRRELRPVLGTEPIRTLLYREATILGSFISLGAVDDLSSWSVADDGRTPRTCSPSHCEVLVLRGSGRIPSGPGLRLTPVGRGRLTSSLLFGDAIPPTKNAIAKARLSPILQRARRYHQPDPPPLVLAEGVRELSASPRLDQYYRTYGWVTPIEREHVHPWSIASLAKRIEKMRAAIQESSFGFEVQAPVDELKSTAEANRLAGRRLLLLGGQASALFFAFVIVVATRFRRDVEALRERLAWAGLPRWQRETTLLVEFLLLAAVGTIIGWAVGTGVVSLIAPRFDEPVGELLRHSVLSGSGIAAALGLVAAATVAIAIASAVRPLRMGGLSVSALDVAGVGAVLAIAVALARGAADADALLRQRGTGPVLLLLPALIAVAAAAVVARILPWLLRVTARAATKRSVALRLAALALARNPGYAVVAVSFLVLTTGFAIFAASYRATLIRGESDQAAFAVGADYVGREDPARLITVRDAATSGTLRSLGPDVEASFATRQNGSIGGAELVTGITVLGLAPEAIRNVRGWRPDFGPTPPPQIADQLAPQRSLSLRGSTLPRSATSLLLRVRARRESVGFTVVIRTKGGYFLEVPLGRAAGSRWQTLGARIPAEAQGGRVVGFRFDPPIRTEEPGAQTGVAARATVDLRPLRARRGPHEVATTGYRDWVGTPGVRVIGRAGGLRLDLALSTQVASYVRPRQPTDGQDVPVLVSRNLSGLAGRDGRLNVAVNGEPISLRITSVASRFPGIPASFAQSDFIVADRDTLISTLNAAAPGAGFVNEIWLNAGTTHALERLGLELRRPPFDVFAFDSRAARARTLSDDPISNATTWLLGAAAIAALALALLGVLVGAASDVRDEAKELFELEAQGMTPRDLRRHLRARSALMLVAGLVGGAVLGVLFAFVVVDLVALSTGTASPQPPLVLSIGWRDVSAAGFAYFALAGLLLAALTAGAFRATAADENRRRSP
jgi:MFS family permease